MQYDDNATCVIDDQTANPAASATLTAAVANVVARGEAEGCGGFGAGGEEEDVVPVEADGGGAWCGVCGRLLVIHDAPLQF